MADAGAVSARYDPDGLISCTARLFERGGLETYGLEPPKALAELSN